MKKKSKQNSDMALAILLLNVLILPGLGSIVGKKKDEGIKQLILFMVGIPFTFIFVGYLMMLGAWIWGLMTGIDAMKEAN